MENLQALADDVKADVDRLAAAVTPELIAALVEVMDEEADLRIEEFLAAHDIAIDSPIAIAPRPVASDESPMRIGDGRMCEKTVQLWIKPSTKLPAVFPSLELCVGWK